MKMVKLVLPLILILALTGCTEMTFSRFVDIPRGQTVEEKIQIARLACSPAALVRLRSGLKAQFPALDVDQLNNVTLEIKVATTYAISGEKAGKPERTVQVVIKIIAPLGGPKPAVPPMEVLRAAEKLVEAQMNEIDNMTT